MWIIELRVAVKDEHAQTLARNHSLQVIQLKFLNKTRKKERSREQNASVYLGGVESLLRFSKGEVLLFLVD